MNEVVDGFFDRRLSQPEDFSERVMRTDAPVRSKIRGRTRCSHISRISDGTPASRR